MGITGIMSTAVAGLQANAERFRVAAFNVVNASSDGFTAQSVNATSAVPAGVTTSITQTDQPVDLAQEFIGMIEAQAGYGANAKVMDAASRMTGALLDIVA